MSDPSEVLTHRRIHQSRDSLDTFQSAYNALKGKGRASTDEEWAVLEQLAISSMDLGKVEVAADCINKLSKKFPNSPRVEVLMGMLLEANGKEDEAKTFYERLLVKDSTNIPVLRRLMSLPSLTPQDRIPQLLKYLDVFYTDIDAWSLLSELYASLGLYTQALACISHPLLLAPQNPIHFLRQAETAYTAGDLPLAFKAYLLCLSLSEKSSDGKGMVVRCWFGLKTTIRALLSAPTSPSATGIPPPSVSTLKEFDLLATKWISKLYTSNSDISRDAKAAVMDGFLRGSSGQK
ncbi:Uncharacterized conserved protein [Phaffia rhodozyma]|uniref:ER membrane protein complex subunit 2 n=1 Tax=Phaffia rhodozyma TaxID=264483 RepID=A0A0F7SR30_PHARH|nr:Uncharacterized conserved protein [Phaffia rhodozyma]